MKLPIVIPDENKGLSHFIGQDVIREDLEKQIHFTRESNEPLPGLLICGPPEIGKSRLARAVAVDLNSSMKVILAGAEPDLNDFVGILNRLAEGEILLIHELDELDPALIELLISCLKKGYFQVQIQGKWPKSKVPDFTLIGLAESVRKVDRSLGALLKRYNFVSYSSEDLAEIAISRADEMGLELDLMAAKEVVKHSDGTPGMTVLLLVRLKEFCELVGQNMVDIGLVREALDPVGESTKLMSSQDIAAKLKSMDPFEFEKLMAALFRRTGFQVTVTQRSADDGIDLVMHRPGEKVIVQCKRWDDTVGVEKVRELFGVMPDSEADFACLVCTSSFSDEAYEFAKGKPIRLYDLSELVEAIRDSKLYNSL